MSCSAPATRASPAAGRPGSWSGATSCFIAVAGTGYLLGITQSKEYAEPEWYADLWLTIVWVVYLLVFLGTLVKRKEPHIYVANWFYLAFIVTDRHAAPRQQRDHPGQPDEPEELHRLLGRAGCDDAMVVRP